MSLITDKDSFDTNKQKGDLLKNMNSAVHRCFKIVFCEEIKIILKQLVVLNYHNKYANKIISDFETEIQYLNKNPIIIPIIFITVILKEFISIFIGQFNLITKPKTIQKEKEL